MVEGYGLTDCNKLLNTTPFKIGLPFDSTPPTTLQEDAQKQVTKTYQQVMGNLKWLSISTRLDITTIHLILSSYSHKPSDKHLSSVIYICCQILCQQSITWIIFFIQAPVSSPSICNISNLFIPYRICQRQLGTNGCIGSQTKHTRSRAIPLIPLLDFWLDNHSPYDSSGVGLHLSK